MKDNFTFIDLFSGIGGFHQAMEKLGGKCLFASEIDKYCTETYYENYKIDAQVNIREIHEKDVPSHDVLCAGFPCQTFSKAGKQEGLKDNTGGTLFFEIERILKYHKTKYIILENVRNLVSHDNGNTWRVIHEHLQDIGYRLTIKPIILSPHQFGIPQLRERVVILGVYDPTNSSKELDIEFDKLMHKNDNSIYKIISKDRVEEKYYISEHEDYVLSAWNEFYQIIDTKIIGFPIWADFFNHFEYEDNLPIWKQIFIQKNKDLYKRNEKAINNWMKKYSIQDKFNPTERKFEWQAGKSIDNIWDGIIQIRPSGIRVKLPTCFPALVAMVQIPIVGRYKRRLSVEEVSKLQSFPEDFIPNKLDQQAYKQFGNSVNVEVIKNAAIKLFEY
ncbi:MAG: DNA (cytosine-5-)-methyltransferase [Peptostreptococcaceae bacterium]|nr:DNA (cytosine-5-)-methyltransferase [Peptostreptococcaceae bacterium]